LELLGSLAAAVELKNLLIIAAFRDAGSGVAADGRMAAIHSSLKNSAPGRTRTIALGPLSERSVFDLIMATTQAETQKGAYLAAIVHEKTGGNPFFIHEFLNTLGREGAFRLDPDEGRWDWDPDRIAGAAASDNVVDLVVRRLRALQPGTAHVLGLAACIGQSFQAAALEALADGVPVAAALGEAVAEGILLPERGGTAGSADGVAAATARTQPAFRFQHSRLHQAAYSLLPADQRDLIPDVDTAAPIIIDTEPVKR
jgi:predicted ATPase